MRELLKYLSNFDKHDVNLQRYIKFVNSNSQTNK